MKVVPVDLSRIDLEDHTFYVGSKADIAPIKESIKEIGILNPPIVREKNGVYQVICGWKRLESAKELGITQVLCTTYGSDELASRELLKIIYLDNKDRLSELEVAELILLHRTLCGMDDRGLLEEVLPRFSLPSSRKSLDKYLDLAALEKEIKDAFFEDKITIEQCQMLSELASEIRLPILRNILLKYKLNNNESRQVIQQISEIASIKLKSILDVISEAKSVASGDKINKNSLRAALKQMRYPDHSEAEDRVNKIIRDLDLPENVNLVVNQFFESNGVELRLRVGSSEELLKIISDFKTLCDKGDIEKLISVISTGK